MTEPTAGEATEVVIPSGNPAPNPEPSTPESVQAEKIKIAEAEQVAAAQAAALQEAANSPDLEGGDPAQEGPEVQEQQEQTEEVTEDATVQKWEHLGNEDADAAIDLMQEKGMTPEDASAVFGKAIGSGNLDDVNVKLLEEKIGVAAAKLAMAGIRSYHSGENAKSEATVKAVYDTVGGEANWNAVTSWAKGNHSSEVASKIGDFRDMILSGGTPAVLAAKELKSMYEAEKGTLDKSLHTGESTVTTSIKPTTRAEYLKQCEALEAKRLPPAIKAQEYAVINQGRLAGRKAEAAGY